MSADREQRAELVERTKQGDVAGVQQLLGAVDTWIYYALETALVEAARNDHLTLVIILLDAGADPSGIGGGEHPLRWRIAMEDCLHCGS